MAEKTRSVIEHAPIDRDRRPRLFQWPANQGMRGSRHHHACAEAGHFRNRAAGLFARQDFVYDVVKDEYRCPAGQHALLIQRRRERAAATQILVLSLPEVCHQITMYDQRLPTDRIR